MCNKDMVLTWAKQVIRTLKMSLNPISLIIDLIDFFTDSTFDGSILAENHILIRENW